MTKVKAQLNNLRISPRKVHLVAMHLTGKTVDEAVGFLDYDVRKSADILAKLLRSARANAVNNFKLSEKDLVIDDVFVGAGPTLKRWRPRAHGRASKILKRTSRVTLILTNRTAKKTEVSASQKKHVTAKSTAAKSAPKKTPTEKVAVTPEKQKSSKDDLTKIEGIGPKIAQTLVVAKIDTYATLAATPVEKINDTIADVRGNHDPATWPEQAQLAHDGKWEELATLQEKLLGGIKQ